MDFKYVELFAGCGGLSLGLKAAGFESVLANELSPMAAESYAYNLLGADLLSGEGDRSSVQKTFWLGSNYPADQMDKRLRENPKTFPVYGEGYCDIPKKISDLKGGLIVGSIIELNRLLKNKKSIAKEINRSFGLGDLDLVSGGPPCQSFSMAGLRRLDCERNVLPWEFAEFVSAVSPKIVLLENVTGILRPFVGPDGDKFFAWFEIAKAFAQRNYIPLCLHVNAKHAGVPQNRPRFVMIGLRESVFHRLQGKLLEKESELFRSAKYFYARIKSGHEVVYGDLNCIDLEKSPDMSMVRGTFLAPLFTHVNAPRTVKDAIDDLSVKGGKGAEYAKFLSKTFGKHVQNLSANGSICNHEMRSNSDLVRRRFRIYQVVSTLGADLQKEVSRILSNSQRVMSDDLWRAIKPFHFLLSDGRKAVFHRKADALGHLLDHITMKQTQRALIADQPAPAALSIPDDACHYRDGEYRTLSVREMARIQGFPDEFVFRSKITTGGQMRRYEVPQYTQVGNAVPPLLALALGQAIRDLLSRV